MSKKPDAPLTSPGISRHSIGVDVVRCPVDGCECSALSEREHWVVLDQYLTGVIGMLVGGEGRAQ